MGIRTYRSGDGPYGGRTRAQTPWPMILFLLACYAAAGIAYALRD